MHFTSLKLRFSSIGKPSVVSRGFENPDRLGNAPSSSRLPLPEPNHDGFLGRNVEALSEFREKLMDSVADSVVSSFFPPHGRSVGGSVVPSRPVRAAVGRLLPDDGHVRRYGKLEKRSR